MTVVVTGASGHIGNNLVRALLEQRRHVRVLIRDDPQALGDLDIEKFRGDVLREDSLKAALASAKVVYHLAAQITMTSDPLGLMQKINVQGTRHVVRACLEAGVSRLVHFSSIHALSAEPADQIIDETRPLADCAKSSPDYDRSKAHAEREVQAGIAQGLNAVIVNPTAVLGPHDYKPSHMGRVVMLLAQGKLPALVTGGFNWVDVRDVVQGALLAEQRGQKGERYLLTGHYLSMADLAQLVAQKTGTLAPRIVVPIQLARIGTPLVEWWCKLMRQRELLTRDSLRALSNHRHISGDKAKKILGYAPRRIEDTIADTLTWFVSAEMLPGLKR